MDRNIWQRPAAFAVGLALVMSIVPALAHATTIKDLGTLGGISSVARAINEPGQIVGESTTANGNTHAFIFTPWVGHIQDIGTLGGRFAIAEGISNSGKVVGQSSTVADDASNGAHAFIWSQGSIRQLPSLPGASASEATAVNDAGQVVGASDSFPVIWQNGTVQQLLPDVGAATGINNNGVIVGNVSDSVGFHGFLRRNGAVINLDNVVGPQTTANAVSDNGNVVGGFWPASAERPHGFIFNYYTNRVTDLGVLVGYSFAHGVSNSGLVAGEGGGDFVHAVLWDYNHVIHDLGGLPGTTFSVAYAVNSGGIVVGASATRVLNGQHAVAWLP